MESRYEYEHEYDHEYERRSYEHEKLGEGPPRTGTHTYGRNIITMGLRQHWGRSAS